MGTAYALRTDNDAIYADIGTDPSVKAHQQIHDVQAEFQNRFDSGLPVTPAAALVWDGTMYVQATVTTVSTWDPTAATWQPIPAWATSAHKLESTRDPNAPQPPMTNRKHGMVWLRHPSASANPNTGA